MLACVSCLWYCKSTIFQANHNQILNIEHGLKAVCDTAKVRFFKQITTQSLSISCIICCLWYCKSTIFQANHNHNVYRGGGVKAVCDTAKVRFFKQITTQLLPHYRPFLLFVILQKYDFSSKSQRISTCIYSGKCCLWYCKSTIFQANHNHRYTVVCRTAAVCDTAKVRFFKQITTTFISLVHFGCLWYCKSTIFQANHNQIDKITNGVGAVCDTAKVRFFKQITTLRKIMPLDCLLFVILQKYDFSSKSQPFG